MKGNDLYQRLLGLENPWRVKEVALREALKPSGRKNPELLAPRPMGLVAGIDPRRLSELADDLEAEALIAAEAKRHYPEKTNDSA